MDGGVSGGAEPRAPAAAAAATAAPPPPSYPPPGEIAYYDYRPPPPPHHYHHHHPRHSRRVLRLAQFNVERGYELESVARQLAALDADVIALQEVDVGCDRSRGADVGRVLAQRLGMCGVFLCEFEELRDSARRTERTQGGGAHGNALLSRFDLAFARRVDHSRHPVDWDLAPEEQPHALARKEPRRGKRAALAARVFPPWVVVGAQGGGGGEGGEGRGAGGGGGVAAAVGPRDPHPHHHDHELDGVLVYSAHLEVFCGAADRAAQYADIVADSRRERRRELARWRASDEQEEARPPTRQHSPPWRHAVLGDLNTMAHGVARLSPHYAQGSLRWRTLGQTEGEWWERHVLWRRRRPEESGGGGAEDGDEEDEEEEEEDPAVLAARRRLERWGVPAQASRALIPNPGFACPFPARDTVTLDNPAYRLPLPRWVAALLLHKRRRRRRRRRQEQHHQDHQHHPQRPHISEEDDGKPPTWLPLMAGKLDWVLLHERGFAVERAFLGNADFRASDHAWLCVDAEVLLR
jgi:endonuclease/exonuclease/phosphatase family metal-dependent hydrolase